MKGVELYGRVRYAVQIEGLSERAAARRFGIDPRTVNKMMKSMQRAICCRIFTPAARPEYPAASLRDYCCGVLMMRINSPVRSECTSRTTRLPFSCDKITN